MDEANIFSCVTESGIRIVCENMPSYNSVSFGVWIGAGSIYENENESGISHFIEHMLFKGTKTRSAKELASEMDAIGAQSNAFTAKNCTCFYATSLGDDLEKIVDIICDMVNNALFAEADMEREKSVVCEEILMTEDTPDDLAYETLGKLMYGAMPIAAPILGTQESVRRITREEIASYMSRTYIPKNIVVACAGNFDRDKLIALINERFTKSSTLQPEYPVSSFPMGERKFLCVNKDIEQAHICIGLPGFAAETDMHFPLIVLSNIFGGSMSSWLFQSIRERRGLAYSVYSHVMPYRDSGSFTMYAGTNFAQAETVIKMMLEELAKLRDNGITEDELARSKNQLKNGYILGLESTSAHASALGKRMLVYNKLFSPNESAQRLNNVTMESCRAAIERITDFDSMSCTLVCKNHSEINVERVEKLIMEYR